MLDTEKIPYFPFKMEPVNEEWSFHNPLNGREYEFNSHAYRLLKMCDGYRTWGEISKELAHLHQTSPEEIISRCEPQLQGFSEQGVLWWRQQRLRFYQVPPPATVLWDITYKCNFRCKHCVVSGGTPADQELSLAECETLLDDLMAFGVREVVLSGGEPLIHPHFEQLCTMVSARSLGLQIATNGSLVDPHIAKFLASMKCNVQVSLDGATAEVHDNFRQMPGGWEKAVQGIKHLVAEGVPVTIGTMVIKSNLGQILDIYQMAVDLGVCTFRVIPFIPVGRGSANAELEVSPDEMHDLSSFLYEQRGSSLIKIAPLEFECTFEEPQSGQVDANTRIGCDGAIAYCTITASGDVVPCNFFANVDALNVREHNFEWIWYNSRFLNFFRSLTIADLEGKCRSCGWLSACRGSCLAANFSHGEIFKSNLHCWLT